MPLIDQFGNKLAAARAPSFDVKIIASRRQVILEQDQDLYRNYPDNKFDHSKHNQESIQLPKISISDTETETDQPRPSPPKRQTSIINKSVPLQPTQPQHHASARSPTQMSYKRKKVSSSETGSELDLNRMVAERMEHVSARTMDLMIMEMRKLDRDRDRVLIPETVSKLLDKYHLDLGTRVIELLLERFRDTEMFQGMVNYEDLVRFLEERRLQVEKNVSSSKSKLDNFILYETEHVKDKYQRSQSWSSKMEEKLVSQIQQSASSGSGDNWSVSEVGDRLVARDDYGHGTVSAPVLRSVLRSVGLGSSKIVAGVMKASQIDHKSHFSIPVIIDILNKAK